MKTKLFSLFLFAISISFAQVPTNGLVSEYKFTNGSLSDIINGDDFTQTGSSLTTDTDRLGVATDAVQLGGDHLTRPNVNYTNDVSISFWIKTTTNDANRRRIIDDKSNNVGMYIFLENGKIGMSGTHERTGLGGPISYRSFEFISTKDIADGQWHHIVVRVEFDQIRNIANVLRGHRFNVDLYIDTIEESFVDSINGTTLFNVGSTSSFGNWTVANNRSANLPAANRYMDAIDDIHIYNRLLTQAEVTTVAENDGFCFGPQTSVFTINNITENEFDITFSAAGNYEVGYVVQGQPITSITTTAVTATNGSTHTISGLNASLLYDIHVREECSATIMSSWSEAVAIRTKGQIYVDAQATGNNNGTSWADAYTDLQDAISIADDNQDIWVAAGRYTPHATDRFVSFNINKPGMKIYGGFAGTETQLNERNFRANETILSGDLSNNDNVNLVFSAGVRNDNSYKVVYVTAANFELNGVTVSDGHGNYTAVGLYTIGSGITKEAFVPNLTVKNCIIKNNVALAGGAGITAEFKQPNGNGALRIENTIFKENLARYGAPLYSYSNGLLNSLSIDVENCLFDGNRDMDNGSTLGYSAAGGWIRAFSAGSTVTSSFINNTYANNKGDGTVSGLTNANRATLAISQTNGTMNATVANCIFWNNKSRGTNTTAKAISSQIQGTPNSISVANSIDEDNFSLIASGDKTNVSNADPLFVDLANGDYTLTMNSPAVDAGNSAVVPANLMVDLLGNQRIFNASVDMGAYEYGAPTLGTEDVVIVNQLALYPNPVKDILFIEINAEIERAEVYNLLGNLMQSTTTTSIDVSNLSQGIYIMKIKTKNNTSITKRFIKR